MMSTHRTTSSNHTRLLTARVLGLAAACSVTLAVAACSGNDTTPDPAPVHTDENTTTTTTTTIPAEEPRREDPRSDSEASALINWILDQPTAYSIHGEATISIPPPPIEQDPPPTDNTTQTAETRTTQAVFESDTEGDLSILAHTPPGLHHYLPEGGSYQIIYEDDTMFLRSPFIEHTRAEQEVWLAFTTTNEHRTLFNGLSCIFFIPEPQEEDTEEDTTPTHCNLQDGLHAILNNIHDTRTIGTETLHDLQTTKISFNTNPPAALLNGSVWIDESNLIRRIDISHTPTPPTSESPEENEQANTSLTLWFHSFGADISVEAPAIEHVEGEHIISLATTTQQKENQ